jgi:hypothetical protein
MLDHYHQPSFTTINGAVVSLNVRSASSVLPQAAGGTDPLVQTKPLNEAALGSTVGSFRSPTSSASGVNIPLFIS